MPSTIILCRHRKLMVNLSLPKEKGRGEGYVNSLRYTLLYIK